LIQSAERKTSGVRGSQRRTVDWKPKAMVAAISVVCSLALSEALVGVIHRHAYPFLNLFQPDPTYGVKLRPDSTTRVRSREGRISSVSTNSLGFRGPEWTPAVTGAGSGRRRVMLLGDSQVFGFGVAYEDSLGPQLAAKLGGEVLNAAVPSWGPAEYERVLTDLAPVYLPDVVVYVGNLANDWFEVAMPNSRRTTARDGWAIRWAEGDEKPSWFPGREFLFGSSHLVLGIRELLEYRRQIGGAGMPAETSMLLRRDLAQLSQPVDGHRSRLTSSLLRVVDTCRRIGCTVVAAALPIDVQVDAREWRKYRGAPIDLQATERLLNDWVADAIEAGVPGVSLLPALRAASPGAFQPDDYHLSGRGHLAVAEAIARVVLDQHRSAEVAR
jgi:hypothetical protein